MAKILGEEQENPGTTTDKPTNNDDGNESSINVNQSDDVIQILIEIDHVQYFLIKPDILTKSKEDTRKEIANGTMKVLLHPNNDNIVFTFDDYKDITYTSSPKFPVIKVYHNDYILGGIHEFYGLYIDVTIKKDILNKFEGILKAFTKYKISNKLKPIHKIPINNSLRAGPPDKIALIGMNLAGLLRKGTVKLSHGIRYTTQNVANGIQNGKAKLVTKVKPRDEPMEISENTQNRIKKAKMAASVGAKVTSAVVTGTIAAANALTNEVSSVIKETEFGKKLNDDPGPKTRAAKELIKSTLNGAFTIYDEVVGSTLHLVSETSHATADVLGKKYGDDMKEAAHNTADIIKDGAKSISNMSRVGVKAVAKRVTRDTTIECLSNEEELKEREKTKLKIDPMTGMSILVAANKMSDALDNNQKIKKQLRQEYIGIQNNESISNNNNNISNTQLLNMNHINESIKINNNDINNNNINNNNDNNEGLTFVNYNMNSLHSYDINESLPKKNNKSFEDSLDLD